MNNCDSEFIDPNAPLANELQWTAPPTVCGGDAIGYYIYYQSPLETELTLIDSVMDASQTAFIHYIANSLAGCYAVAAVDSFYNVGVPSNTICVENCPLYILPNVFTPNDDGDNDLFVPRSSRFVSRVDFKVFNRWGGVVFETQAAELNWNGTDGNSGKELPEGVYFYTCQVFERTSDGVERVTDLLSGYIHLLRGS